MVYKIGQILSYSCIYIGKFMHIKLRTILLRDSQREREREHSHACPLCPKISLKLINFVVDEKNVLEEKTLNQMCSLLNHTIKQKHKNKLE